VVGVPCWNGTTLAAEDGAVETPVGCRVTWVAVTVVPLVVPSTRTGSPVVTAAADVEVEPLWYVVVDASSTVTF
jgi:hypothetical protein